MYYVFQRKKYVSRIHMRKRKDVSTEVEWRYGGGSGVGMGQEVSQNREGQGGEEWVKR